MAASTGPNLGLAYGWTPRSGGTPGDSGWGDPVSANFKLIDALVGLSVLSASAVSPVVSTDGTRYIVPHTGGTGAFAAKADQVAVHVGGAWEFHVPARGWLAENQETGRFLKFNGTTWVDITPAKAYIDVFDPAGDTIPNGGSFAKVTLTTVVEDNTGGWDAGTSTFTPVVSGLYLVDAMISPMRSGADLMPADTNLRLGFGSALVDSYAVVAATSTDLLPFTLSLSKPMRLTAGIPYFVYANHSAAAPVALAKGQLKIVRLDQ